MQNIIIIIFFNFNKSSPSPYNKNWFNNNQFKKVYIFLKKNNLKKLIGLI